MSYNSKEGKENTISSTTISNIRLVKISASLNTFREDISNAFHHQTCLSIALYGCKLCIQYPVIECGLAKTGR